MLPPMIKIALVSLVLLGCGRAELQGPPASEPVPAATVPACVASDDFRTSRWACETVGALEIVSAKVQNADGTSPWTYGAPAVRAVMRNTTGDFLNYPGVQVGVSVAELQPRQSNDSLYGLSGCQEMELGMGFGGSVPRGTQVTFTVSPTYITGLECPHSYPPLSVTVTAP